ncbi:hypothetical protein GCM10009128_24210 [Psychrosphaera haliotis]|uniref:XrtA-associated tyrosine autokinase n=1 Tax=Psychrosphaera haliotis TaxID=555083 RepID=UPI0031D06A23
MSSIEKAMQRQGEKAKFGQPTTTNDTENQAVEAKPDADLAGTTTDSVAANPEVSNEEMLSQNVSNPSATVPEVSNQDATVVSSEEAQPAQHNKDLVIDIEGLEAKGFVALSRKRTLINEEFRSIKRKVLNNAFGGLAKTLNHSNLVLVSSSRPNEGKTFTAVNLALSIALEQDKTVLLVDADVLKPSVSKTLEIGANVGLIEYLTGEEENVSSVIYHTNIENLKVIPAGLPHHLSNELLSSDKMLKLCQEFANRYPDRIVVFDCPPLLGVNETALMAEQCGQGVIVVEEFKSKVSEVKQAVDLLPESMAVGFVLNKVTDPSETQGYGYYYGTGA